MLTAITIGAFVALLLVLYLCGQFLFDHSEEQIRDTGFVLLVVGAAWLILVAARCVVGINP